MEKDQDLVDQLVELQMAVDLLSHRINQQDKVIKGARGSRFVKISEVAEMCGLSSWQLRKKIKESIDRPADNRYRLKNGVHYLWGEPGRKGSKCLVDPELFLKAIGLG